MFTQTHLPPLPIETLERYFAVMQHHRNNQAKKSALFHRMKKHLIGWTKTAVDFRNVMSPLTLAERDEFYRLMQEKLPPINKTSDFLDILTYLPIKERLEFYASEKETLFEKTNTGKEFGEIYFFVPEQLQALLCADIMHFKNILKPSELFDATRHCSESELEKITPYFKPKPATPVAKEKPQPAVTASTYLNHESKPSRRRFLCEALQRLCQKTTQPNPSTPTKYVIR